ncbi:hypothetical protein ACFFHH_20335 [Cytobacillus solani]|uniref:Uncharacterized protein n=1 Tax=Cytobacillus solani TaxID=1637975 RepID=A0A0Q3VJE1_9BACI|nr:hypothetical protein [Cytobacillus solani]KOP84115.1 hypothetical protein AMS60_00260 [Bacillus sp. FJAT-21945]KQL20991.1 hypothetical protein AN957_22020 [Cytobacillus solani]USK54225.1 hypothetical protein LIS82_22080 [Cytobacillus solani]
MTGFIAKQPNGLYCHFSSIVDCPTHYNMSREDYLSNVTRNVRNRDEGEIILRDHLYPITEVIDRFIPRNMTQTEFDKWVVDVSSPYDGTGFKCT